MEGQDCRLLTLRCNNVVQGQTSNRQKYSILANRREIQGQVDGTDVVASPVHKSHLSVTSFSMSKEYGAHQSRFSYSNLHTLEIKGLNPYIAKLVHELYR